ncbi:MAG: pentapeptide repeat-containing protein [Cyanobacteria bacterium J06627_28]
MAESPVSILRDSIDRWNQWRAAHPGQPCSLAGQNLSGGYYYEGDFSHVDLSEVDLRRACLIGANFRNADLSGANLSDAYVDGADFRGAILTGTLLEGVNLSRALRDDSMARAKQLSEPTSREASSKNSREIVKENPAEKYKVEKSKKEKSKKEKSKKEKSKKEKYKEEKYEKEKYQKERYAEGVTIATRQPLGVHERQQTIQETRPAASSQPARSQTATQLAVKATQSTANKTIEEASRTQRDRSFPFLLPAIATVGMAVALSAALFYVAVFNNPFRSRTDTATDSTLDTAADSDTATPVGSSPNPPSLSLVKSLRESSQVWAVTTFMRPDGRVLVMGGNSDGDITIWDGPTGEILHRLTDHNDTIRTLAVSPSGQRLVSGSGDGIKVWQPETGELLYSLPAEPGFPIWSVAISPDEQTFVSGDYSGNITVWDLETGEQRYRQQVDVPVWSVAVAPDGDSFVSGSSDRTIRQWSLTTGELIQELTGHKDAVRAVAISPDGETLISGSWDATIKVWDLASGELTDTLDSHSDRVVSLAISPDGQSFASSSVDRTLKIWDLPNRQLAKTLDTSDNWVLTVDFDPAEQTLVSGGKDQTIKIWQ